MNASETQGRCRYRMRINHKNVVSALSMMYNEVIFDKQAEVLAVLQNVQYYIRRIEKLRRYHDSTPHKPLLLLSVIELIEQGKLIENKITLSPDLIKIFKKYWSKATTTRKNPNIPYPFFHLKNDGFWHLHAQPGFEEALRTASQIRTMQIRTISRLREVVANASLDDELFALLSHPQYREMIRHTIINRYFPNNLELENNPLVGVISDIINGYERIQKQIEDLERQIGSSDVNHHLDKFEQQLSLAQDRCSLIQHSLIGLQEHVGNEPPKTRYSFVRVFARNPRLSKYLKELYDWKCQFQNCGLNFFAKNGKPYVETHHLEALSKGGNDIIDNIIVVCAHHHAMLEHANVSIVLKNPEKVIVEINGEQHTIKRIPLAAKNHLNFNAKKS